MKKVQNPENLEGNVEGNIAPQPQTTHEVEKRKLRKPGQFYMEIRHDPKKDRDEGDDFIFNLEVCTGYPSLCQLQTWDAANTYLKAITNKVQRYGFDITLPLSRENFKHLLAIGKLTASQQTNIAERIQRVFVHTINGIIQRMDPSSAAK